jgi:hypothetical protein
MTPTIVHEKPKVSLCLGCIHLSGDWSYCDGHEQDITEIGHGKDRRLITLSCTGFQAKPKQKAAVQGEKVGGR